MPMNKNETLVGTVERIERERNERVVRDVLRGVLIFSVMLLLVAVLMGCSGGAGALVSYGNDNGPRGDESFQLLPFAATKTPCAPLAR